MDGSTRICQGRSGARASHGPLFFAGFCLVANGAYLTAGAFAGVGDAAALGAMGQPVAVLVGLGGVEWLTGLALWHGLGPAFRTAREGRERVLTFALAVAAATTMFLAALVVGRGI